MKKLEMIIRREKVDAVKTKLSALGATGIMLSNIAGFGNEEVYTQTYRGQEYTFHTVQKMRVEVVVPDELVEDMIAGVLEVAQTGVQGDGKIYVYEVLEAVRIRNGQRGIQAL